MSPGGGNCQGNRPLGKKKKSWGTKAMSEEVMTDHGVGAENCLGSRVLEAFCGKPKQGIWAKKRSRGDNPETKVGATVA